MPKKNAIDWQPELLKLLKDPEDAMAYLSAAKDDEDPALFLIALRNVIEAQEARSRNHSIASKNR